MDNYNFINCKLGIVRTKKNTSLKCFFPTSLLFFLKVMAYNIFDSSSQEGRPFGKIESGTIVSLMNFSQEVELKN